MGTRIILDLSQKIGTFTTDTIRYLRTHVTAVDGLLGGDNLINLALLPTALKIGLKPIGGISYAATTMDSFEDMWMHGGTFDNGDGVMEGHYVNIDVGGTFAVPAGHIITNGDDGGGSLTGGAGINITLEKNDWVVFMGLDVSSNKKWQIMNHTYPEATTTAAGLMSSTDKVKLNGLSNYTHPTFNPGNQDLSDVQTIDTITFGANGHISAITTQAIRSATETLNGIVKLATQGEVRQALTTDHKLKAVSRERVIDIMKYFEQIPVYASGADAAANLAAANLSDAHGEGAFVFIKSGEVTV